MKKNLMTAITKSQSMNIYLKKQETKELVYFIHSNNDMACDITVNNGGYGASSQVYCVVIGKKGAHIRLYTKQLHTCSNATSNIFVRSVLLDGSTLSFEGSVVVGKQLHGIHAGQRCDVLTLDNVSRAVIKPNLEILSDDVFCTHAATIGSIPDYVRLYLESRGISVKKAEDLFTLGFLTHGLPDAHDKLIREHVLTVLS